MKNINLLVWLTQFGLSVAVPPVCFIGLAAWLRNSCGWGRWVIWAGIVLGIYCAITGFVSTLRGLQRLADDQKKEPPATAFKDHE